MSGIYISGMEMPKGCFYCPMRLKVDPDTIKCLATGERFDETFAGTIETRNRGKCPLVPVPPHGDLVDKQRMAETNEQHYMVCKGEPDADYARKVVLRMLDQAPTVIPADGEEVDPSKN